MKATCRSSRRACARHNDRDFDTSKADHIDAARTQTNYYWHIDKNKELSFEEMELKYYKKHFSSFLEARNQHNKEKGHPERVISINQFLHKKRTCPEEVLLQIGSLKDGTVSPEVLQKCMREYVIEFNKKYGQKCTILNLAVHLDEATPHVHIRRVWHTLDANGREIVNQKQALKELGFERPDTSKEEDRYNNAKIPFSKADRELFLDVCERYGLELDREPVESRKRLETDIFKLYQELDSKKLELSKLESIYKETCYKNEMKLNDIFTLQNEIDEKKAEVDQLRKDVKSLLEEKETKKAEVNELKGLIKNLQRIIEELNKNMLNIAKKVLAEHERKKSVISHSR